MEVEERKDCPKADPCTSDAKNLILASDVSHVLKDQAGSSDASNHVSKIVPVKRKGAMQEKETFQRINYLYQAANLMMSINNDYRNISTFYCSVMHGISQKSLIRLEPDLKRTMCRGCKGLMIPGVTATVRVKPRPYSTVLWKCLLCGTMRRLPAKRNYKLWVQRPEASQPS